LPQVAQTVIFWIFFCPGITSPTGTLLKSNPPQRRQRFFGPPPAVTGRPQYGHLVTFLWRKARHFGQTFWRSDIRADITSRNRLRKALILGHSAGRGSEHDAANGPSLMLENGAWVAQSNLLPFSP
jgi:hypothetical protein